jgi:pSer/pThr/pTyr-binding forkhead associated (FHA) protein
MPPGLEACPVCSAAAGQGKAGPIRVKSIGEEATVSGLQVVSPPAAAAPAEYSELLFDAAPGEAQPAAVEPGSRLDPAIDYLLQLLPGGEFRPWELKRPYYSVGREGAKIALADRRVSRRHLAVVRVGPDWLAINLSREKRLRVNGGELRQKTLRSGDALRIGDTWLVFAAGSPAQLPAPLRPMGGRYRSATAAPAGTLGSLEEDDDAQCSVYAGTRLAATSAGRPLLIGSHPLCPVRVQGAGVAALHCLLTWLPAGLHVLDLGGGSGTLLDGRPVHEGPVRDGQVLTAGGQALTVRLAGDPCAPGAGQLRRARETPRAVALTVFHGPCNGETVLLPPGRTLRLGRSPEADLCLLGDARISRHHLDLTLQPAAGDPVALPAVRVHDAGSRSGTVVNRQPVAGEAAATVGDVIQFGSPARVTPTALLLHYDLCLEAW